MNNIFKQIVVAILIAGTALMTVGCYGSFNLTKKVYNWTGTQNDRWIKELVFLGLCVIPVYEVAVTVDAIILNSMEFWTSENSMTTTVATEGGTTVVFNQTKKELTITYSGKSFTISREEGKSTVKDAEGKVLAYAVTDAKGNMSILDLDGNVLSSFSNAEVMSMIANN